MKDIETINNDLILPSLNRTVYNPQAEDEQASHLKTPKIKELPATTGNDEYSLPVINRSAIGSNAATPNITKTLGAQYKSN